MARSIVCLVKDHETYIVVIVRGYTTSYMLDILQFSARGTSDRHGLVDARLVVLVILDGAEIGPVLEKTPVFVWWRGAA